MGLLEGKVAVITGAGRGIGREHALLMAKEGAKVVVNDLGAHFDGTGAATNTPAQEVVAEIKKMGGDAVANGESVSDFKGAKRIIQCALDTFGQLNIIVNNAGILRDRMIFNMTKEEWDAVLAVHLDGTFFCTRAASIHMREQKYGRIISMSSVSALGSPGQPNYGAAKAGIIGLTRSIAKEAHKYGITANAMCPSADTRMTQRLPGERRGLATATPDGASVSIIPAVAGG